MTVQQLEQAAANARPKPCPICDAPAMALWTGCYLRVVIVCLDAACRCKVERQWIDCSPMRALQDALKAWNKRD